MLVVRATLVRAVLLFNAEGLLGMPDVDMVGTDLEDSGSAEVAECVIEAFNGTGAVVKVLVALRVDSIMDVVEVVSKQYSGYEVTVTVTISWPMPVSFWDPRHNWLWRADLDEGIKLRR